MNTLPELERKDHTGYKLEKSESAMMKGFMFLSVIMYIFP